jgi:pimeloyl-ACP methyl ester carboxylesterase
MAAAPQVLAQQTGPEGAAGSFYEKGPVRIHYEVTGSGFPLLLIAGGGLNSTMSGLVRTSPFNPIEEFKGEYRCISSDLRNANGGQSSGPLEVDRPWDAYTDDHLGLMDHLGIDKFMVLGFCIGGPLIWNLLRRAPDRIVAAVLAQPSGSRPEVRDLFYEGNIKGWGPELTKRRPDITMETVDKFLTRMYRNNPDFVISVTRDFVRNCQTPVLVLPDDIPAHPYAVAMEAAMLAPRAGEYVSVEGSQGTDSPRGPSDTLLSAGASIRVCLSGSNTRHSIYHRRWQVLFAFSRGRSLLK